MKNILFNRFQSSNKTDIYVLSNGEIYISDWLTLILNLLNKYGFEIFYFEPVMNLIAKKNKIKKTFFENNVTSIHNSIINSEKNFSSRKFQNSIRIWFETKGIFALLILILKPINKILIILKLQKYIKLLLKRIYKLI